MLRDARFVSVAILMALCAALFFTGCSDSPPSQPAAGGASARGDVTIDPAAATFVFQSLDAGEPGEARVRVDLIGRNLTLDPGAGRVLLEVAVRNQDRRTLYAPLEIVASGFVPAHVMPTNADWVDCGDSLQADVPAFECAWGFDYSSLLGDDGALAAGEISEFRLWEISNPGMEAFTFGAAAHVALDGGHARLGGLFFHDRDENGIPGPDEAPLGGGWVLIQGPGIEGREVRVGRDGRFLLPVRHEGLYTLLATPPETFQAVRFTTPNPLEVVLLPGPDGAPQSYLDARFGMTWDEGGPPPALPILFVDALDDSIPQDPCHVERAALDGFHLVLEAGYGGCQPEHLLRLYRVGGFMESMPVQARLFLSHDDLEELCDAWFVTRRVFDLRPLVRAYVEAYGAPGRLILLLEDGQGETRRIELVIPG